MIAMLVKPRDAFASVQHEGECNDQSSRSRSSRIGAFSGCRIGPDSVPRGTALQLCRSSLAGTAWVQPTGLRSTSLCTDPCLPSAADCARLLRSAVSRGFGAII
jgi:hypothetical protein